MHLLAHVTPEIIPSYWLAFFGGAVFGALVVLGLRLFRSR